MLDPVEARHQTLQQQQHTKTRAGWVLDPAYKYDMLYRVLFANVNAVSKFLEMDLCGDKTTWGHQGYGEAGSGLMGRIVGKPGITKGGQIVMVSDVHWIRPRAYVQTQR